MIKAYAALESGGELKPFEYDPGPIGYDFVEIQVEHCGICHSDLSMLDNEWGIAKFPLVPGHEVVGTISAVGKGVSNLQVGKRVGLGWHSGYCMTCPTCMSGDHNMCAHAEGTIVNRHGGLQGVDRHQTVESVVDRRGGVAHQVTQPHHARFARRERTVCHVVGVIGVRNRNVHPVAVNRGRCREVRFTCRRLIRLGRYQPCSTRRQGR